MRKVITAATFALAAATTAGCVGFGSEDAAKAPAGFACVDDSQHCIQQRAAALNALMADPSRSWVREPSSPQAYASGVRMYAFKQRKQQLTCDELGIGKREADAAPGVLRGPQGVSAGLTPAQVSRGVMFAGEVGRELANEQRRRCRVG